MNMYVKESNVQIDFDCIFSAKFLGEMYVVYMYTCLNFMYILSIYY